MEVYNKRIDASLGKLLAAASELAFEYSNNDREGYQMARLALVEILRNASQPFEFNEDLGDSLSNKRQVH
jgi:hypothetical protein